MSDSKKKKKKNKEAEKKSKILEYVNSLLELHKLQEVLLNYLKKEL